MNVHESYLEAWDEFDLEENHSLGASPLGRAWTREELTSSSGFAALVQALALSSEEQTVLPAGRVPETTLWFVEDDQWLGRLSIRHRLTPALLEVGGHIGYAVRPSARRRGHATKMLIDGLTFAGSLGINPVLVTCDEDNHASLGVIKSVAGWQTAHRDGVCRFWIPT